MIRAVTHAGTTEVTAEGLLARVGAVAVGYDGPGGLREALREANRRAGVAPTGYRRVYERFTVIRDRREVVVRWRDEQVL